MESVKNKLITVETTVKAPVNVAWSLWTEPKHITKWCYASDDWHAPRAENDLHVRGRFTTRMESKDGTSGFDFSGVYTRIERNMVIEYSIADGRKVKVHFTDQGPYTHVVESFEPESENPAEMQKGGWQAILDNYRRYVESKASD